MPSDRSPGTLVARPGNRPETTANVRRRLMLSLKNNIVSRTAARHMNDNYADLGRSVARLASGLRINGADDDAAGLAVRELVRADAARLQQGARNAQDAISMLQTAEGAVGIIDDILVRMQELAEQASTESYSTAQRTTMNNEFQELIAEIDRVAADTAFNGITLLNSDTANYKIQVGSTDAVNDYIQIDAGDMTAEGLSVGGTKSSASTANAWASAATTVTTTATTIQFAWATGADFTTAAFTAGNTSIQTIVDEINEASRASDDYNAAELRTDADTGAVTIVVHNEIVGNYALTVTGNAGVSDLSDANWNKAGGSGTNVTIDTVSNATTALTNVTTAITTKDSYRGKLGYWMNRLDYASNVATLAAENLGAAESRISDVDAATEMAAMTRNQVLAQAGISMLAQANIMPRMALTLMD